MPNYPFLWRIHKHGVTVAADALSEWNKVEERYNEKTCLAEGKDEKPGSVQRDVVIDVPVESQVHKQVIRKDASVRTGKNEPSYPFILRRGRRTRYATNPAGTLNA